MMTNFSGFESIIDTLGGITVNAAYELYDRCDLPQAVNKMCYVPAGQTTMDGATALWYVRSRYSTDDFDRTRRAQEVILAIIKKTMSLDALNRAAELYDLFQYSVETDIPLDIIIKLLPIASDIVQNHSIIQQYAITESDITPYVVPVTGAMVLIPDNEAVANIIRKAIYP
jgi:anionic cell wall polymer biosynthesis LytR-Cps2A-Psr (LCP) family protein